VSVPTRRELRRAVDRHRRLLAGGFAGLAVVCGLSVVRPRVDTARVVVADRDVAAGSLLTSADLSEVAMARGSVPDGAVEVESSLVGRRVAGAVRRGEVLTDARVLGPGLLGTSGLPTSTVAVPVRLTEPGLDVVLRAGDRVDVLATPASSSTQNEPVAAAVVIAADALVLSLPAGPDGGGSGLDGGTLVLLATTQPTARALAAAAASSRLSVAVRAA
jgi:Flp pilus assembly protein CpaB